MSTSKFLLEVWISLLITVGSITLGVLLSKAIIWFLKWTGIGLEFGILAILVMALTFCVYKIRNI